MNSGGEGGLGIEAFDTHTVSETAKALGISITAVKARLFHARSELRKDLKGGHRLGTEARVGFRCSAPTLAAVIATEPSV